MPVKTEAFDSMAPAKPIPFHSRGHGGEEARPFTLQNLEAPRKFSGQGKPAATTWLTKMLC